MFDVSTVNGYMKNHTLSQHNQASNNGNTSSGNGFINIHTLSQCSYSSNFKYKDGDVENCDVACASPLWWLLYFLLR